MAIPISPPPVHQTWIQWLWALGVLPFTHPKGFGLLVKGYRRIFPKRNYLTAEMFAAHVAENQAQHKAVEGRLVTVDEKVTGLKGLVGEAVLEFGETRKEVQETRREVSNLQGTTDTILEFVRK